VFEATVIRVVTNLYNVSVEKSDRSKPFWKRPVLNFGLEIHSISPPPPYTVGYVDFYVSNYL
jgi:hypothetical protein